MMVTVAVDRDVMSESCRVLSVMGEARTLGRCV